LNSNGIFVPKFFTPNGDGYNDYWNIKGVNNIFSSKSIIYIFDRYGKLMKQILPSSQGWDGTINGEPMPADDYWFTKKSEKKFSDFFVLIFYKILKFYLFFNCHK